ncbi:MAG: Potassium efflux system KefA protein / Small-conductance mechanosensitive channel [Labilithrix sp.]|nr:Potassium efflux system KefA protein / Small-conductance mechanosensitive channel [Labilithrix sp.]
MSAAAAMWGASSWLVTLPLLAAAAYLVGRLLAALTVGITRRLASRQAWAARLVPLLRAPITMGWALAAFWTGLPYLPLTPHAHEIVTRVLRALGYLAFFWALLRAVTIAGDEVAGAKWARVHANVRSIADVGVTLGRIVVGALALMVALSQLGYNVTTVIAGLGIGGVALALAAQKTVENLFGSVSILADQPFKVGDTVRVDGIEGAVETIGLRSTRIRTVERTLVIIPNGKLADMRVESLGPRDRIRFSTKLALSRETSIGQIQAVIASLETRLLAHASVSRDDASVRLGALGEWSFDIDVAAPVETTSTGEFARIREDLLLECIRAVEEAGAVLAIPARRIEEPRRER